MFQSCFLLVPTKKCNFVKKYSSLSSLSDTLIKKRFICKICALPPPLSFSLALTREGWPLLTVETENAFLGWFVGLSCRYKRFLFCLACLLVSPVQNILFLTAHFFTICVPNAQQTGQAVVPGRLPLNMCLWSSPFLHDSFPGPPQAL